MNQEDIRRIKVILDDSLTWDEETIKRMPKLFLLIRENYIRGLRQTEGKKD